MSNFGDLNSRDPALAGLHGEQREHRVEAVVVVEVVSGPPGQSLSKKVSKTDKKPPGQIQI